MTDWQKMSVWRAGAITNALDVLEHTAPTPELWALCAVLLQAFIRAREGKCPTCGCGSYTGPDEAPTFDPEGYPI